MHISTLLIGLSDKASSPSDQADSFDIVYDVQGNSYYYPALIDNSRHMTPESRWHLLRAHLSIKS